MASERSGGERQVVLTTWGTINKNTQLATESTEKHGKINAFCK
jgi:hypothetical protein